MTEGAAIELAKCKMKELGITEYRFRYRDIRMSPYESITIKARDHYYFLIEFNCNWTYFTVHSNMGIYNYQDTLLNELQHVHTGIIRLKNKSGYSALARFIQVIPKNIPHGDR